MQPLTEPFRQHHQHCDDLFITAENAVRAGDWTRARSDFDAFLSAMEVHFGAEEELLFPAFEAETGMRMGPAQVMRHEHAQMRELFKEMATAIAAGDAQAYAGAADTLLIMMQQHNIKEENILYPMCDQRLMTQATTLAPALQERLGAA